MAIVAAAQHREEPAARLLASAHCLRDILGPPSRPQPTTWWRDRAEQTLASVRERLGQELFAAAWAEGEAWNIEQASAYARDLGESGRDRSIAPQRPSTVDA
jgi:hypothetical protein